MNDITINNRSEITLTKVKKVISITSKHTTLELDYALIDIIGEDLEMIKINETQTDITLKGIIKEIIFDNGKIKNKTNFLKKLFE